MILYAKSSPRIKAAVIDTAVVYVAISLGALCISALPFDSETLKHIFQIGLAIAILYEPITVSLFGASYGHYRANIQVVDNRSQRRIGLIKSLWRFLLKTFFGWLSLIAIATGGKRLSLHDMLSNSSVQMRDPSLAHQAQCEHSAPTDPMLIQPSPLRLGIVILLYFFLANIVTTVLTVLFDAVLCSVLPHCSPLSTGVATALALLYTLSCAFTIGLAGKGKLYGCRNARRPQAL